MLFKRVVVVFSPFDPIGAVIDTEPGDVEQVAQSRGDADVKVNRLRGFRRTCALGGCLQKVAIEVNRLYL